MLHQFFYLLKKKIAETFGKTFKIVILEILNINSTNFKFIGNKC